MRFVPLVACAYCLLVLGGCGGSSDESTVEGADDVTASIDAVFTTADERACEELQTQAFLEQTFLVEGSDAMKSCEGLSGAGLASSVDVSDVSIDGGEATAAVSVNGSPFDSQTLDLKLIDDGTWKLDELTGFEDFDPDAYADAFLAVASTGDAPEDLLNCIADNIRAAPDGELEAALVDGDVDRMDSYAEDC